jgi:hypothetical protein
MDVLFEFDNKAVYYTPLSFEVTQRSYSHEMAVVKFALAPGQRLPWSAWTPAHIRWSNPSGTYSTDFWGYVWNCEYEDEATSPRRVAIVVCVGATMPMKSQRPRSLGKGTASYAIRETVRGYSLQLRADPTRVVIPAVTQGQESDWAFITRLAEQNGLVCYAKGPTVFALSPTRVIRDPQYYTRTYQMGTSRGIQYDVLKFSPTEDELGTVTPGQVHHASLGVDTATGKLIHASVDGSSGLTSWVQPQAVQTFSDAQRAISAASVLSVNWTTATATIVGDPALQAATTLALSGDGIGADYAGLWLVLEATHYAVFNVASARWNYTSEVTLGRDGPFNTSYIVNQETSHPRAPQAMLLAGRWVHAGGLR